MIWAREKSRVTSTLHFLSLQEERERLEEVDDDDNDDEEVEKGGFVREIKGKDDGLMRYVRVEEF